MKKYNDFINRGNNLDSFDSNLDPDPQELDSLIMRKEYRLDSITGERKEVKALIKYKCIVSISENTGKVSSVAFYKMLPSST
jgi:hypothetical protein